MEYMPYSYYDVTDAVIRDFNPQPNFVETHDISGVYNYSEDHEVPADFMIGGDPICEYIGMEGKHNVNNEVMQDFNIQPKKFGTSSYKVYPDKEEREYKTTWTHPKQFNP